MAEPYIGIKNHSQNGVGKQGGMQEACQTSNRMKCLTFWRGAAILPVMAQDIAEFPVRIGDDLTDKQQRFLEAYSLILAEDGLLVSENDRITRAAICAGYSEASAQSAGWRLMRHPKVLRVLNAISVGGLQSLHSLAVARLAAILENGTDEKALAAIKETFDRGNVLVKKSELHHKHEEIERPERSEMIAQMKAIYEALAPKLLTAIDVPYTEVKPSSAAANRVEAIGDQPETNRKWAGQGPNYVLKPQDPTLPRRGRPPKARLVPGAERGDEEMKAIMAERKRIEVEINAAVADF